MKRFFILLTMVTLHVSAMKAETSTDTKTNTDTENSTTTFENLEKGYSIEFPSNWIENKEIKDFDLFIIAPENESGYSTANLSIISGNLPQDIDLQSFYDENIKNLLSDNKTIKIIDKGDAQIDGIASKWILYSRGDSHTKIVHYFLVRSKVGYLITYGAKENVFDQYKPELEKIVKSFKFEKRKETEKESN